MRPRAMVTLPSPGRPLWQCSGAGACASSLGGSSLVRPADRITSDSQSA